VNQSIERRSSPRDNLPGLVRVRESHVALAGIGTVCVTENISSQGIYFIAENDSFRQRTHLLLSFPHDLDGSKIFRECLAEVVRLDSFFPGRCGVGARLPQSIHLVLRDGLIVPETGFWKQWPPATPGLIHLYA
jgi:hypothetical protein